MNEILDHVDSLSGLSESLRKEVRAAQDLLLVEVLDDELPQWRTQPWTHDRIKLHHVVDKKAEALVFWTEVQIGSRMVGRFGVRLTLDGSHIRVETARPD